LEHLLILERILAESNLSDEYRVVYRDPIPSDIKGANRKFPHNLVVEDTLQYKLGKAMVAYEMWFGHSFPICTQSCSVEERLRHAEQALNAGLPYLSEKEYDKLKTKYKKNAIKDNWFPIARIHYAWEPNFSVSFKHISVTRTASGGAVVKYAWGTNHFHVVHAISHLHAVYSLKLNMREWFRFISDLDKFYTIQMWGTTRTGSGNYKKELVLFSLNSSKDEMGRYCVGGIETHRIIKFGVIPCLKLANETDKMRVRAEKKGKKLAIIEEE
jgi:hypothetical protein